MAAQLNVALIDAGGSNWPAEVDRVRRLLGAPTNPLLFPPHFFKTTFPHIGGYLVVCTLDERFAGAGFLFPRALSPSAREYTLRFHPTDPSQPVDPVELIGRIQELLPRSRCHFYNPSAEQDFCSCHQVVDGIEYGRPAERDAAAIRSLQQTIWDCEEDYLYPVDIHSTDFRASTSLVARTDQQIAGFAFGFYSFGGPPLPPQWHDRFRTDLRMESQLLGVHPRCRGGGIGFHLKRLQAEAALREGIDLVHWTVDPLQLANAMLNLVHLGAVALHFYPNYHPFRNVLNQVAASRLQITWLITTNRARRALTSHQPARFLDLAKARDVITMNQGTLVRHLDASSRRIAIEVPAAWTALQQQDLTQAQEWRAATDAILTHCLGGEHGRYILTGLGAHGPRRYLIAERVNATLLDRLAE